MTVAKGRQFLSIPGPTNVPDAVLAAMQRPAIDIYSGEMIGITDSCLADLKSLFRTKGNVYIYAANGHGGWEAALTNVLSRGDAVLALDSGRFARGWGEMASMLGVEVEVLAGDWRRAVDPAAVEERLKRDKSHVIKAILVVQIDTASGVANDIQAIRKAMDAAKHPALLMVDTVASLGCMPFDMDGWGVDVAMCGSQKGLMTPPGLAFVAANERAREIHKTAQTCARSTGTGPSARARSTTRSIAARRRSICCSACARPSTCSRRKGSTPPSAATRCWRKRRARPSANGARGRCSPSMWRTRRSGPTPSPASRYKGRSPKPLLDYCRDKCGVVLGVGLGEISDKTFRIAHMGHTNAPMVLGTLGAVEMGLKALAIPHGSPAASRRRSSISAARWRPRP